MDRFTFTTDLQQMDVTLIHEFLSQSYWAKGIPFETQKRALKNSLCVGVLTENGEQVAFARLVTDRATFAYLADVFVLEQYRGQGISQWMMEQTMSLEALQGLRRMMLATFDAHGLYEKFGFTPLNNPDIMMEIWTPDVYERRSP